MRGLMETLRYDYKPKAWGMALAGFFFVGCGVILGKTALENHRGLVLNGIIQLDTGDATIFYWVLTAACALAVAAALFGIVDAFGAAQEVVLDETSITVPKGMFGRVPVTVRFTHITDVRIMEVNSQKMLMIHHPGGTLTLPHSMLPTREDFDELADALGARYRAAQGF